MQKLFHFLTLILLANLLVLGCSAPADTTTPPSPGATPGDVWLINSANTAEVGDTIMSNVRVNTGDLKLAAYTFEFAFDQNILDVDTGYDSDGVAAGSQGFVTVVNNTIAGKLIVSSFDVNGVGPDADLDLLNIRWNAVGSGTSVVTLNVTALSDETTKIIGTPKGYGTEIVIN